MTLYGQAALDAWLQLEADPTVEQLCERPLIIPDTKPMKIVDFWAMGPSRNELILVRRESEKDDKRSTKLGGGFEVWASEVGCTVRWVSAGGMTQHRRRWIEGWTQVIQYVNSYSGQLTPAFLTEVATGVVGAASLGDAILSTRLADRDLARAAIYCLVHQGIFRLVDLGENPLDDDLVLEVT